MKKDDKTPPLPEQSMLQQEDRGLSDKNRNSPYEQIRSAIRTGKLKPGSRVTETHLAEWLNVSRTPIREAILMLEQDGLFQYAPRQGLIVSILNYEDVVELYAMREVLEGAAASLAAKYASDAELSILNEVLEAEQSYTGDDQTQVVSLNRQFHQIVCFAAHNQFLIKSLGALDDSMMLLGPTTLAVADRHASALDEHSQIVAAIEARDAEAAEKAARNHIRSAQVYRLKMMIGGNTQ
ncbi:GntR family transcriptional regulator [Lentibacter algarum]|uniref:GntR family transcriptional regulator n=1 Tax=Lentibacter algarum TaxID=576131 RepID=UPI001C070690|nr:GntR family transcriptional regulator [Lentibacter algarum]MBU2980193.1 GntR family transcriptional regulator [Lentibacter algarum]